MPILLAGHPSLGAKNVKELIAVAKAKPEQVFYGSSGMGTAAHLAGELLNVSAGVKIVHVPYPGSAQALTDLLAGRIQLMFGAASTSLPHVADGKLVAFGMAQRQRAALAPHVPTLSEQGLADFDASLWFGLMAPAGTPRDIVDKLARAVNEAIKTEEVIAPLRVQGIELTGGSPEDFAPRYRQRHQAVDDGGHGRRLEEVSLARGAPTRAKKRRRNTMPTTMEPHRRLARLSVGWALVAIPCSGRRDDCAPRAGARTIRRGRCASWSASGRDRRPTSPRVCSATAWGRSSARP